MANDIRSEMLRFGLITDYRPDYEKRVSEIEAYRKERKDFYTERIKYYDQKDRQDRVQEYEQRYNDLMGRLDERLASAEASYERKTERMNERVDNPIYQTRLAKLQLDETKQKQAAAQEKMRQEKEVMQREEGERQAARFRARGSRAGARPMLSTARISPAQTMAQQDTLGAFMPK